MRKLCLLFIFIVLSVIIHAQLSVTSFSPKSGPIGSSVTLTGTGFSSSKENNIVHIGGIRAEIVSATNTSIVATVPTGNLYSPISVTTNGKVAFSSTPFLTAIRKENTLKVAYGTFRESNKINISDKLVSRLVADDLNNDGKPDIALTATGENAIYVSINNTSGITPGFSTRSSYPSINSVYHIVTADLNGDGRKEIVVANDSVHNGLISFYPNNTSGNTFNLGNKIDLTVNYAIDDLAAIDLNNDGKLDLVALLKNGNKLFYFLNTSSEENFSFLPLAVIDLPNPISDVCFSDLDGDGKTDIVLPSKNSWGLSVMLNNSAEGLISFNSAQAFNWGGSTTSGVVSGDIDLDGKPDIAAFVIKNGEQYVSFFKNNSTPGNITIDTAASLKVTIGDSSLHFTDFNADGRLDFLLLNKGMARARLYTNTPESISPFTFKKALDIIQYTYNAVNSYHAISADLNGDGTVELITNKLVNLSDISGNEVSAYNNYILNPYIWTINSSHGKKGDTIVLLGNHFKNVTQLKVANTIVPILTISESKGNGNDLFDFDSLKFILPDFSATGHKSIILEHNSWKNQRLSRDTLGNFLYLSESYRPKINISPSSKLKFRVKKGTVTPLQSYELSADSIYFLIKATSPPDFKLKVQSDTSVYTDTKYYNVSVPLALVRNRITDVKFEKDSISAVIRTAIKFTSDYMKDTLTLPILVTSDDLPQPAITIIADSLPLRFFAAKDSSSNIRSYKVFGKHLYDTIYIKAPDRFLVATHPDSLFKQQLNLIPVNDQIDTTTVYVKFLTDSLLYNSSGEITHESEDAVIRKVSLSASMPRPSIHIAPTNPLLFTARKNEPTSPLSYTVAADYLLSHLQITAPAKFTVSLSADSAFTQQITLLPINGKIDSTRIYVRFLSDTIINTILDSITHTSLNTIPKTLQLTANVDNPVININHSSISTFNARKQVYTAAKTFTLSAKQLYTDLTITARGKFEISKYADSAFTQIINLSAINSAIDTTTIYVRFYSDSIINNVRDTIFISSQYASVKKIALLANMLKPTIHVLTNRPITFTGTKGTYTQPSFYHISAEHLFGNLIIEAPRPFQLSLNPNDSFRQNITLTPTNGKIDSTMIFVRFFSDTISLITNAQLTHSSEDASNIQLTVSAVMPPLIKTTLPNDLTFYPVKGDTTTAQSFQIEADNIREPVTIVAPNKFLLSLSKDINFTPVLTINPLNDSISRRNIFVRFFSDSTIINRTDSLVLGSSVWGPKKIAVTTTIDPTIRLFPADTLQIKALNGTLSPTYSYRVSGFNLKDDIDIFSESNDVMISRNPDTEYGNRISISGSAGKIDSAVIYVRYLSPRVPSPYAVSKIRHSTTGAVTKYKVINATIEEGDIDISNSSDILLTTKKGIRSPRKSYWVTAKNINDNLYIYTDGGLELSLQPDSAFKRMLIIPSVNGQVDSTLIYVSYQNDTATHNKRDSIRHVASGAKEKKIGVLIFIERDSLPQPVIHPVQASPLVFTARKGIDTLIGTYKINAQYLTQHLSITAPSKFKVSTYRDSAFAQTISLIPVNGKIDSTLIYIRFFSDTLTPVIRDSIAHSSAGVNSQYLLLNGSMTQEVVQQPVITLTPASTIVFTAKKGIETLAGSYKVSAIHLTQNLSITAPDKFKVSTRRDSAFTQTISLTPVNGKIDSTLIYIRFFSDTLTPVIRDSIAHSSAGVNSQYLLLNGSMTQEVVQQPVITLTPASAIVFTAKKGIETLAGSYKVSALHLTQNLSVTAPDKFKVSTYRDSAFAQTISLIPVNGKIDSTLIYIKFFSDTLTPIIRDSIVHSTTGINSQYLLLHGSMTQEVVQQPIITLTPASAIVFTAKKGIETLAGSYKVSALHLTQNLSITAPDKFKVSTYRDSAFAQTISLIPVNGKIDSTLIYIKFSSDTLTPIIRDSIVHSTTGINSQYLLLNGSMTQEVVQQPIITLTPASTIVFTAKKGIETLAGSYKVSALHLTQNLSITAPDKFKVSTRRDSAFAQNISLTPVNGKVDSTLIYVRFLSDSTISMINDSITHSSNGAISKKMALSGSMQKDSIATPSLLFPSGTAVSFIAKKGITTQAQSYTIAAQYLQGDLKIIAPEKFQVSIFKDTGFTRQLIIAPNAGKIDAMSIFVRFLSDTLINSISDSIQHITDGLPILKKSVTVTMQADTPLIKPALSFPKSNQPVKLYAYSGEYSNTSYYALNGKNLTSEVTILAPKHYQVSLLQDRDFAEKISIHPVNGSIDSARIFVRYFRDTVRAVSNEHIIHISTGADTLLLPVSAEITPISNGDFSISISHPNKGIFFAAKKGVITPVQSYKVSAKNIFTNSIIIVAPEHFAVSLSPDTNFSSRLTLKLQDRDLALTDIYVRYYYNGDISLRTDSISHYLEGNPYRARLGVMVDSCSVESITNAIPIINNVSTDSSITCFKEKITLSVSSPANANRFRWSTGDTTSTITISDDKMVSVRVANNQSCFSKISPVVHLVRNRTEKPSIGIISDSILTSTSAGKYRWYYNNLFTNKTDRILVANKVGLYRVEVSSFLGYCWEASENFPIVVLPQSNPVDTVTLLAFPNPNTGSFMVSASLDRMTSVIADVTVISATGNLLAKTSKFIFFGRDIKIPITISNYKGVAHVRLVVNNKLTTSTIIIQ